MPAPPGLSRGIFPLWTQTYSRDAAVASGESAEAVSQREQGSGRTGVERRSGKRRMERRRKTTVTDCTMALCVFMRTNFFSIPHHICARVHDVELQAPSLPHQYHAH